MSRACGSCTLCCRLFAVPEVLKPRDVWCRHCVIGHGCGIYPDWPKVCNDFFCLWRDERLTKVLTDDLRPDRCGTVMVAAGGGTAICAVCKPDQPFAWRDNDKVFAFLVGAAAAGTSVSVRSGKVYFVVGSRGYLEVPTDWVTGDIAGDGEFKINIPDTVRMKLGIGRHAQQHPGLPTTATANVVH